MVNAPFGSMTKLFQIPRRLGRTGRSLQATHADGFAQNRQAARTMLGVKLSRFDP